MASIYVDSSALAKRYLLEPGTGEVEALLQAGPVATSVVTRAEVVAAIARSVREGSLDRQGAGLLRQRLAEHWPDAVRHEVTDEIASQAAELAWEYGLRGFDAIHLATALSCQHEIGSPITFATFDRRLWRAARAAGLDPWPEGLEP